MTILITIGSSYLEKDLFLLCKLIHDFIKNFLGNLNSKVFYYFLLPGIIAIQSHHKIKMALPNKIFVNRIIFPPIKKKLTLLPSLQTFARIFFILIRIKFFIILSRIKFFFILPRKKFFFLFLDQLNSSHLLEPPIKCQN